MKHSVSWLTLGDEGNAVNSGQASQGGQDASPEERFTLKTGKEYAMPGSILRPKDEGQLGPEHAGNQDDLGGSGRRSGVVQAWKIELPEAGVECWELLAFWW